MTTDDELYLSVIRDGDHFAVVDQHGRRVAHVVGVSITAPSDDAVKCKVEFYDHKIGTKEKHQNIRGAK